MSERERVRKREREREREKSATTATRSPTKSTINCQLSIWLSDVGRTSRDHAYIEEKTQEAKKERGRERGKEREKEGHRYPLVRQWV